MTRAYHNARNEQCKSPEKYVLLEGPIGPCGPGSLVGIATGYGLDGPGIESRWEARFFAPVQTGPGSHPAFCTTGTESFAGVKSGRGVKLTPHLLPVPWSRKSRAIPLLPLRAVRPVQSLSACTRMRFTYRTILQPVANVGHFIDRSINKLAISLNS